MARHRLEAGARRRALIVDRCPLPIRGDSGFGLIEVVIAFTVLVLLLTGLGLELTTQYSSVGASGNEQSAEGVLDRALNEVRGMPFVDVAEGLSNTDNFTGTTMIVRSGTSWTFHDPALQGHGTGEAVAHYKPTAGTPPAPFYPHNTRTPGTVVDNVKYSVFAVPTLFSKSTTGAVATWVKPVYRVTIIVSWQKPSLGGPTTLVGQTLVYSKTSSCKGITSTSDPFAAPCQPNYTSTASVGGGTIDIQPVTSSVTPIQGLSFKSMGLVLPSAATSTTLIQTSSILGSVQTSGAAVTPGTSKDELSRVTTRASNDPSVGAGNYQSLMLSQTSTAVLTESAPGTSNALTVQPSAGDSGTSVSTTAAKASQVVPCANLAGTAQTTSLPCGSGKAIQAHAATIVGHFYAGAGADSLGATPLATVTGTTTYPNRVFTGRFSKTKGPNTTGAPTCPSTATVGCVYSVAEGGLGTMSLGGLPPQIFTDLAAPSAWTSGSNFYVKLVGYSAKAWSWAQSTKTPGGWLAQGGSERVSGTAPVLSYYTTTQKKVSSLTLTGGAQTVTIPPVTVSDPLATGGALAITLSATLTIGSSATSDKTTTATAKVAHISSYTVLPPITGSITYKVVQGATTIADFTITVKLEPTSASASYQVAS